MSLIISYFFAMFVQMVNRQNYKITTTIYKFDSSDQSMSLRIQPSNFDIAVNIYPNDDHVLEENGT